MDKNVWSYWFQSDQYRIIVAKSILMLNGGSKLPPMFVMSLKAFWLKIAGLRILPPVRGSWRLAVGGGGRGGGWAPLNPKHRPASEFIIFSKILAHFRVIFGFDHDKISNGSRGWFRCRKKDGFLWCFNDKQDKKCWDDQQMILRPIEKFNVHHIHNSKKFSENPSDF